MAANSAADVVLLSEQYPIGRKGVDRGTQSPLFRAFGDVILRGKPGNRLFSLFFVQHKPDDYHWLGVLVFTKGKRLLFFPGTYCPFRLLEGSIKSKQPCTIDHLTLDADGRGRHLTSITPKIHVSIPKAPKLDHSGRHWFTIHYSSTAFMHPLHCQSELRFPVPSSDSGRRCREIDSAIENAPSTIVRLHGDARHWNHNHVGFTFYVGGPGFGHTTDVPAFPAQNVEIEKNAIRTHVVDIDGHTTVQITAYCTAPYLKSEAMLFF